MSNNTFRVTVAHRPPFVLVANNTAGSYTFSGLLIDLLNKILATSDARLGYTIYVSPSNAGGTLGSNGRWSGVIGELVEGRADVALFPLTRTAARLKVIDATFSYLDQGLGLLVRDSMTGPGPLSVLAPFSTTLWVTLLCTVIGVALLFWALDAYGRWIRAKQTEALRTSGVLTERQIARAKKDDRNPVLISFMAAAGAPERPGRASWGVQVLYVVYCFFCLIVLSAYTANLTSYLAVRRANVGITGLQDIARDNGFIGVNPNGSTAAYFANSQDTLATQLQPHVRYCATDKCLELLRGGTIEAFVSDMPALTYIAEQQPCDLATVGDPFGPGNLVIGLVKNSTWLALFNNAIQAFSEDGTLTALERAWFDNLSQCDDSASALNNSRLTIGQMIGAFVFLVAGILIAFVTGTVENLKWCLARAYARSYSEPETRSGAWRELSRMRTGTWRRLSTSLLALAQADKEREGMEETTRRPASAGVNSSTPSMVLRPPRQQSSPGAIQLDCEMQAAEQPPATYTVYGVVPGRDQQDGEKTNDGAPPADQTATAAAVVVSGPAGKAVSEAMTGVQQGSNAAMTVAMDPRRVISGEHTLSTNVSAMSMTGIDDSSSALRDLQLLPMMPAMDRSSGGNRSPKAGLLARHPSGMLPGGISVKRVMPPPSPLSRAAGAMPGSGPAAPAGSPVSSYNDTFPGASTGTMALQSSEASLPKPGADAAGGARLGSGSSEAEDGDEEADAAVAVRKGGRGRRLKLRWASRRDDGSIVAEGAMPSVTAPPV